MRRIAYMLGFVVGCSSGPPTSPFLAGDPRVANYDLPAGEPADLDLGDAVQCTAGAGTYGEVTESAGLSYTPRFGAESSLAERFDSFELGFSSVEVEVAGGFAVGDFNGDGHLDVVVADYDQPIRAFAGDGALGFTPWALDAIPDDYYRSAQLIDVDGDGDLDLYLLGLDENVALRNDGAGQFVDATADWNLGGGAGATTTASWADFDGDGDLDVYNANYGDGASAPEAPTLPDDDVLLVQEDGVFVDRSLRLPNSFGAGHGYIAGWFDAEDDGDLDLLVANDLGGTTPLAEPNHFARNVGGDDWVLQADPAAALDRPILAMGLALGDADGDGDLDVHVTNAGPSYFGRNDSGSEPLFTDLSLLTHELSADDDGDISWATDFVDLDGDGQLELWTAFGYMPTKGSDGGPNLTDNAFEQPDRVWRLQDGDLAYEDVAADWGLNNTASTRTMSTADFDRDGSLEVLSWSVDRGLHLSTRGCAPEAWLRLHLQDSSANSHGIGARVDVLHQGEWLLRRDLVAGSCGALGTGAPELTIGVGDLDEVDLVVTWPDGVVTVNAAVPTRRGVTLTR